MKYLETCILDPVRLEQEIVPVLRNCCNARSTRIAHNTTHILVGTYVHYWFSRTIWHPHGNGATYDVKEEFVFMGHPVRHEPKLSGCAVVFAQYDNESAVLGQAIDKLIKLLEEVKK